MLVRRKFPIIFMKSLLILIMPFVLLLKAEMALTIPVNFQNYTNDLLRAAKSAQMKSYMDEQVSPCENFYRFACGKWPTVHATKASNKSTHLDYLKELYWRKILKLLKELQPSDTTADMKVKDFYESCRSKRDVNKIDLQRIFNSLELPPNWPRDTNQTWYESEYDWLKTIAVVKRKIGQNILIGLNIISDPYKKVVGRIVMGAPELDFKDVTNSTDNKQQQLLKDAQLESVQSVLTRYFPDMSNEWSSQVAKQVQGIEINLAKNILPSTNNTNANVKQNMRLKTVSDLASSYGSYIDISRYLNLIFNQSIYAPIFESPQTYFTNLVDVIRSTPKLIIANYTMWKTLQYIDVNSPPTTNSPNSVIEEWCVHKAMEYFPKNLEKMYLRNYETIKMLDQLQSVWSDVKDAFRYDLQNLNKLTWMSNETRWDVVDKLNDMGLEYATLPSDNNQQMEKLIIRQDRYYENLIRLLQWQTATQLEWPSRYLQSEEEPYLLPEYNIRTNKIKFPTQFLQNRFFWDDSYPHSLLYSTLGFLLAQQMLKAFDPNRHIYDKSSLRRLWWDSNSESAYNNRSNCFEMQYANYPFHGRIKQHEKALLSSYITDNGALNLAYQSYQQWWYNIPVTKLDTQEILGYSLSNYKPNQLFYIAFAQLWCASYNDRNEFEELPEEWRVIGSIANQMGFAEAFQCPLGTLMNSDNKCLIF